MVRTQVYLEVAQDQGLKRMAMRTGLSQSQLIRDAVDRLLATEAKPDWRKSILGLAGLWADRPDIVEEMAEIRASADRDLPDR